MDEEESGGAVVELVSFVFIDKLIGILLLLFALAFNVLVLLIEFVTGDVVMATELVVLVFDVGGGWSFKAAANC